MVGRFWERDRHYLHVFDIDDDGRAGPRRPLRRGRLRGRLSGARTGVTSPAKGAAFAKFRRLSATGYMTTFNRGDLDRMLAVLTSPGMRVENRSRSSSGSLSRRPPCQPRRVDRDGHGYTHVVLRRSLVVADHVVARCARGTRSRRRALCVGTRLRVRVFVRRSGRSCEFELDDEDAAFAYAEELARIAVSRLDVSNRASRVWLSVGDAMTVAASMGSPLVSQTRSSTTTTGLWAGIRPVT